MQPPGGTTGGRQVTNGDVAGWPWSTISRVPGGHATPKGTLMRSSFFCSPSISMMATLTTRSPDSTRPSLTVTQMRLALGSASLLQSFTQGEKISCGASPAGAACCACGAGCGAAAGACGAGLGAGFFGAGWAAAIAPNITVAVTA